MTAWSPLFFSSFAGLLIATTLLKPTRLPHKFFFVLLIAPPLGLGACSLIQFYAYVLAGPYAKTAVLLASFLLVIAFIVPFLNASLLGQINRHMILDFFKSPVDRFLQMSAREKKHHVFQTALRLFALGLFLFLFLHFLRFFWGKASWNIFGGWDARYFWMLKARFLARDPSQWTGMFSPILDWTNPDYPLLIPGAVAWGWTWSGSELLVWPALMGLTFAASLCALIIWYLTSFRCWWVGLLGGAFFITTPAYQFWSTTLYTDVPYAFYATGALVLLLTALRMPEKRLFFLSGLLTGFGAWTKNEGGMFTAIMCFLMLAAQFLFQKEVPWNSRLKHLASYVLGLLIPLSATLVLKSFFSGGGTYLLPERTFSETLAVLTNWQRAQFTAVGFWVFASAWDQWHSLWILFAITLVLSPFLARATKPYPLFWLTLTALLLTELGYFTAFMLSPLEIGFHLQTALQRLLLHSGALAIIFSFETFGYHETRTS